VELPFANCALLLAGASALGFASNAVAQTTASDVLSEVVVTGSRVISNGNNSPTPLTVVNTDQLASVQPTTVADALNILPVFAGSRVAAGNPGTGLTNNAANVMNLRGIGFTRTLVLFDGHRVPPTTQDGLVDVDMIPQMLLKRVDTVTGGASAVYGSDAISGVVNFITDTKFEGVKVNLQSGISQRGDDNTWDGGVAFGTKLFGDRGHFEASYQYRNDPGILDRRARDWGKHDWTVQGGGTTAAPAPFNLTDNTRFATTTFGGRINSGPLADQQFATDGVLTPFVHGTPAGTTGYESGGDGGYYNGSMTGMLKSHQLFGRMDYDFTDTTHGYLTVAGTANHNLNYGAYDQLANVTISAQNAYLAQAYQSQLAAGKATSFKFSRLFADMPRIGTESHEDQYFINGGLGGQFAGDYKWDLSLTHSAVRLNTRNDANINNQNLWAALDAVVNPATGQTVCRVTLTNAALYPGCVPLNAFGPTSVSPEAMDYVLQRTEFTAHTKMDDVTASVTGAPFNTWAGPATMAVSGEWRRLSYEALSNAQPGDKANCTGLTYNCTSNSLLWADATLANRSQVSQKVSEGAFEINLPLLEGVPFAKDVAFNGAARYTNYDTSGSYWSWKFGLDWHMNDQLKLRATRSRDIRAPNLNDLFQPQTATTGSFTDLLTGQSPTVTVTAGGNPNLKAEIGNTVTAGIVYEPTWLPRFSIAVDSFHIDVSNAITNIQGTNPTVQAVCYASGGTSPYCALQTRPLGFTNNSAANAVTSWTSTVINISNTKTSGADLEINYETALLGRPLALRGLATYQPHILYITPGLTTIDMGGVAFGANALQASPKVRTTLLANYKVGNFAVDVMERWRSKLKWSGDPTQTYSQGLIPSVAYTNLNLAYRMGGNLGDLQVFFNVQNLFDKQPPPAAGAQSNGNIGVFGGFALGDDPVGRYFTLGVRFRH
jgi:iron complex outermembrane receptor protein